MVTVADLVTGYMVCGALLFYGYFIVDFLSPYFWKEEEEEEEEDIELGFDYHQCCLICHEDVFLINLLRIRGVMVLTVSTVELEYAIIVIGLLVLSLIGILPDLIQERRDLILEDVKNRRLKKSADLKNCLCGRGVDRCTAYREDLKELQKAHHVSKCKHITTTILASFKDDP